MQESMGNIHTELVRHDHSYTSVDVPWQMDDEGDEKLFRYLRGGGVRAFGRTSHEAERIRRQSRFLVLFAALAFLWFLGWVLL